MTPELIRRLTLAHGLIAWLDALLLLALAQLLLRRNSGPDKPWLGRLAFTTTLLTLLSFASGLALEMHYRIHVRQRLFIASTSLGWLFERKMHLSFGVLLFALSGFFAWLLTRKDRRFFPTLRAAYLLAAFFALTSSVLSLIVRWVKPFSL